MIITHCEHPEVTVLEFPGNSLRGANLRDAYLWAAELSNQDLRGADLRGSVLTIANLRGADLRGADLRGAFLSDAKLAGALIDSSTRLSRKMRLVHRLQTKGVQGKTSLAGRDLSDCYLYEVEFANCNFNEANLDGASIGYAQDCSFDNANLTLCELPRALLLRCSFRGANLKHAEFRRAMVYQCDFTGALFSDTDLRGMTARNSTFPMELPGPWADYEEGEGNSAEAGAVRAIHAPL